MKIDNHSFEVFERNNFVYRVNEPGAERVKDDYVSAWTRWKEIVEASVKESGSRNLMVENTEHWQNSGNLRRRFWSRIKDKLLQDKPSCIAEMISKDNLRVYLEWHGYKNEKLHEERKLHNSWVESVAEWVQERGINQAEYKVWTNKDPDEDYQNYITLEVFLKNYKVKSELMGVIVSDSRNWIRIGKVYPKVFALNHENMKKEMGQTIYELEWLYKKATGIPNKAVDENPPSENYEEDEVRDKKDSVLNNKDIISHIHTYIKSKGFHYTEEDVINLFLSIKTKPFVILSGISGTGKTKIVQWFAESVGATEKNGRFSLIPVRPDWNDSSDLLGYVDIQSKFKSGPLTKVIEQAEKNPSLPYFVLLDEMNLARVEHYFSDILSVMETRRREEGNIVTSTLLTKEIAGRDIKLPTNLYVIGTVNMDETTHPFSKKVLDRANTIEFNRVALRNLAFLEESKVIDPIAVQNNIFQAKYLHLKDLYGSNKKLVDDVTDELEKINKSLQSINAHVGYRVRDEICFYLDYNENSEFMDFKVAFDHCVLQKILPRISGSDIRVENLLSELFKLFTGRVYVEGQDSYEDEINQAKYPKSAAKVVQMLRRLGSDGFTSFWIS
ncbi:HI_0552 family protein [Neobacillus cucumis]|nr:HI_0552 family protein [Neobacillus cucumis]